MRKFGAKNGKGPELCDLRIVFHSRSKLPRLLYRDKLNYCEKIVQKGGTWRMTSNILKLKVYRNAEQYRRSESKHDSDVRQNWKLVQTGNYV